MFKSFIPYATAKSVYDVDIEFLKSIGIKTIFIDIDNTLDSYKALEPTNRAKEFISMLKNNFNVALISNNKKKKISHYCSFLDVDFVYKAFKPLPRKMNTFIKAHNYEKDSIILMGDQLMTDVWCAHNVGIKCIWCEKIVEEDQWTTHINRIFEKPIAKYHRKRNNLKNWRELYVKM